MRAALRSMAFRLRADFLSTIGGSSSAVGLELAAASASGPKERRRVARFFFVILGRVEAGKGLC